MWAATPGDRRLVEALAATMGTVFPTVHAIDVPGSLNTLLIATRQPTSFEAIADQLQNLQRTDTPAIMRTRFWRRQATG